MMYLPKMPCLRCAYALMIDRPIRGYSLELIAGKVNHPSPHTPFPPSPVVAGSCGNPWWLGEDWDLILPSIDRSIANPHPLPFPILARSCGNPWWLGEDWDARCARCGWDCEARGFGAFSFILSFLTRAATTTIVCLCEI